MKNITSIAILASIILFLFSASVLAESDNNMFIYIDDKEVSEELEPILRDDRTYAPVRNLAETLGAEVKYQTEDRRIIISHESLQITMWVDNQYVIVNDKETETDSPVFIEDSRSYAPLRFLAEWFDYSVLWDKESGNIELTPLKVGSEKEEDKEKEEYIKPDFKVSLGDEEINIEMSVKDQVSVSEDVYKEHSFIDKQNEKDRFTVYFTGEKYKKTLDEFYDPLLNKIILEPLLLGEDGEDHTVGQKVDEKLEQGLNVNKLTFELKYPIPADNLEFFDEFKESDKLKFNIFRIFEQLEEEIDLDDSLKYRKVRRGIEDGPLNVNKLYFNPIESDLTLDLVIANDEIKGLETIISMSERKDAIAAINGGYFHWQGDPLGLTIRDGLLITQPRNLASAFIMDVDRESAQIKQVDYGSDHKIIVNDNKLELKVNSFNRAKGNGEIIVYTREFGKRTGEPNNNNDYNDKDHIEFVIKNGKVEEVNNANSEIPYYGYVISIDKNHEKIDDSYDKIKEGSTIKLEWDFNSDLSIQDISFAIGAGPGLLSDGEIDVRVKEENVAENISTGKNPRTAIGIFPNGEILLMTVDGRNPGKSIGLELLKLAEYFKDLGVDSAVNLDGGGSTQMWLDGKIVNHPSDSTLRSIGNAVIIK